MANEERMQVMRREFSELRQAIASDIDERFKAGERRLREGLSQDLTHVIVQQLETAQQHLEGRLQVHMEDLKSVVRTTAEGYGGVLDSIKEDLATMNKKMDTKFSGHGNALANHNRRLVAIERSRRGNRRRGPKS